MLPFWLQDDTFRHGEELTLIVLVMSMLINYNSFQLSVVAFPILYLISYEAIAEARVDRYYDPVSGEQLTPGEQLQFKIEYMARVLLMLAVFLTHHYLTLLDLSKMAIEKHMLSRSQSQLYDFINQSTEPTIVLEWVENQFQFVMSNKKADKLLKIDPEGNNANSRLN
jgi:hypothetical protein